ncbi:MAG: efflux RND transporter periplasmic adaptor subunit [Acidobacteriota bacterium]
MVLCLVFGATLGFGQGPTGKYPPPPKKTPTTRAEPTVIASGELRAIRYIKVTSEVSGRIQKIYVQPGDQVKQGQALVLIQPAPSRDPQAAIDEARNAQEALGLAKQKSDAAEAAVTQARKEADVADSDFKTSERELKRAVSMLEAGVVSRQEYDGARERYDQAKTRLANRNLALKKASEYADQQRAVLIQAENRAKRTNDQRVRDQSIPSGQTTQVSPIDGVIADVAVRAGDSVSGGLTDKPLITIADMSTIYAEVIVDENEISRVEAGQAAWIVVDAFHDKKMRGLVRTKQPRAASATPGRQAKEFKVAVELRAIPANTRDRLRPGMSATATIMIRALGK